MDRLTPEAVSLMEHATRVAAEFGHSYIGPEHLLLAFAQRKGSPECTTLGKQGLFDTAISNRLEAMFGRREKHDLSLRFNAEAKSLLLLAETFLTVKQPLISTELIFALLLKEVGGVIDDVLLLYPVESLPSSH